MPTAVRPRGSSRRASRCKACSTRWRARARPRENQSRHPRYVSERSVRARPPCAPLALPANTLVAYATAPGSLADRRRRSRRLHGRAARRAGRRATRCRRRCSARWRQKSHARQAGDRCRGSHRRSRKPVQLGAAARANVDVASLQEVKRVDGAHARHPAEGQQRTVRTDLLGFDQGQQLSSRLRSLSEGLSERPVRGDSRKRASSGCAPAGRNRRRLSRVRRRLRLRRAITGTPVQRPRPSRQAGRTAR